MKSQHLVLRVPSPLVRFNGFESSALLFYCRCFISARKMLDMWDLASDLRFAIMKSFKENDIVIPFPQTVVHLADKKGKQVKPIDIKFDSEKQGE